MLTDHLPRVSLGFFPTPIHEMPRLARALGGPKLWVKRDDQTGLAVGGNKTRKLEFSVADALQQGCDTLVTLGGVQSNHCRQTAAAAVQHGLNAVLVLGGDPPQDVNGNLLLDHILGAEVVFAGQRTREETGAQVMRELEAAGKRPYYIPIGASNEIGATGFVAAFEEFLQQSQAIGQQFDRIVFASSSAGTQTGMAVAAKALGYPGQVAAIAIDSTQSELQETVAGIATKLIPRLGLDLELLPREVVAYDGYLGAGYAIMGEPEKEAIALTARSEGILVDPVYTGRAMAGLIDLIRKNEIGRDENILFWHTGGSPALYAYAKQLMEG